jgi:hypothetical protein
MRVDLAVYFFAFVCVSAWSTEENSIAPSSVPDHNLLRPCVTIHNPQVSEWRKNFFQTKYIQTIRFTSNRIRHPLQTLTLWRSLCLEFRRRSKDRWRFFFLPGTTWCLPNGCRIARRWDECRSACVDRPQFIEALRGRLAELGYMLLNYGYWESGIALD